MSNAEIAAALAPDRDWRTAYPAIETEARSLLGAFKPAQSVTTTNLADLIYNPNEPHDHKVRKRVFQALSALATRGLAAYVTIGEMEEIGHFGSGRRKTWHAPRVGLMPAPHLCHACKRPL